MHEIKTTVDGIEYAASYEVDGETLVVFLPDGSRRETVLRKLKPAVAAMTHLRSFALTTARKSSK